MNQRDVNHALSAANPIDLGEGPLPPLTSAEREFLGGVVAEPQDQAAPGRSGRAGWLRRGLAAKSMTLAAVAVGALAFLLLPSSGRGPAPVSPEPAYAAELARIAKQDPQAIVIGQQKEGGSRAFVVERDTVVAYTVKPLSQSDNGWTVVDPAVVWDCSDLPCDRRTDTPQEAKEMFQKLQREGN